MSSKTQTNFMTLSTGAAIMSDKYISTKEVCQLLGISRSTFYRRIVNHPAFSTPLRISENCIRYRMSDIHKYCDDQKSMCLSKEEDR